MTPTDYTTDPEYISLLRRILELPEDDAPRLILSDWIEEHGDDERAEFIRWQVNHPQNSSVCLCFQSQKIYGEPCNLCKMHGVSDLGEKYYKGDTPYVVNRGLISEIRLTCAEFVGRPCGYCNGRGDVNVLDGSASYSRKCHLCNGTGHIEGVVRELFERHPITSVVLTDFRPSCSRYVPVGDGYGIGFYNVFRSDNPLPTRDGVPGKIFQHITGSAVGQLGGDGVSFFGFRTEEAIKKAVSDACVKYGRALAELPELET